MRKTIKTREGKVLGVWVAKTAQGFNKKQKVEIAKAINSAAVPANLQATKAKARVFVVWEA